MRFSCESCGAQYMISDEKVAASGVKVRCKRCGSVIPVRRSPAAAPVLELATAGERVADDGAGEAELERELGNAFQNVFLDGAPPEEQEVAAEPAGVPATAGRDATQPEAAPMLERDSSVEGYEWYVAIDERQVGPLGATAVRARWESGEVGPDTLAWRPGLDDWMPLASVPEMSRYLSAVSRDPAASGDGAAHGANATQIAVHPERSASGAESSGEAGSRVDGTYDAVNGHDASWQPSVGSALAALASEEIASREQPSGAPPVAPAASRNGSLLDQLELPEGGVDPTHLVPLPMRGLEPTTEVVLKRAPAAAEATEIRQLKKSARRSGAAAGVIVASSVAIAVAAAAWYLKPAPPLQRVTAEGRGAAGDGGGPLAAVPVRRDAGAAPAAVPGQAPAAAAPGQPASAPDASLARASPPTVETPAPAAASPMGREATSQASVPAQAPPAPATPVASTRPAPERPASPRDDRPPIAKATHRVERPSRTASASRVAAARPSEPQQRRERGVAAPAPPPSAVASAAPAADPPKRKAAGDPLLDIGGDGDLEKELSAQPRRRSVYVPPAIGSDLPEGVSVSQINEAVVGQKAALLSCIEQQKSSDPEARGTLKLRWVITGDGSPRDVRVLSDEFARQPIATCISGVVKAIRFPRSRTAGQEVVFPFKF